MPSALSWAAQGLLLAGSVAGAVPAKRQGSATLQLDIIKSARSGTSLRRRQTAAEGFSYNQNIYVIPVTLGTPPQTFFSQLDTGSSNLVAFPSALQGNCPFTQKNLCDARAYNANASTSATNTGVAWDTSYGDGDAANGYYYLDSLSFNGNNIPNFGFLYASVSSSLGNSVFGTGYAANEGNPNGTYENLPLRLTSSNYINNPVFSLYLNSDRSTPGSLLYGGVDSAKYCGNLATLPIQLSPTRQIYDQFNVQLANLTATGPGGTQTVLSNPGLPALFDSGTSSISLPQAMFNQVLALYNGQPGTGRGYPQVDCSLGTSSYSMSFGFNGVTINVPLSEVVSPPSAGQTTCDFYLNVEAAGNNPPIILGTSFLTSTYTVFDLVDNNLYVAQAIFDAQGSNIMPVNKGTSNVVPLIAGAPCGATSSSSTTTTTGTATNIATSAAGSMTTNNPTTSSMAGSAVISPNLMSTSTSTSTPPASMTSSMSHGWPWSCPGGGWWTTATSGQNFWTEWNGVTITEGCSYSAVTTVTSQLPCTNIIPFTTSTAWSNGQPYPTECPYAVNGHPIAWDESGSPVVPQLAAATGGPWSHHGEGWADSNNVGSSGGASNGGQWADNGSNGDTKGQWADNNGGAANAAASGGANGGHQWADNNGGSNGGGSNGAAAAGGQWADHGAGASSAAPAAASGGVGWQDVAASSAAASAASGSSWQDVAASSAAPAANANATGWSDVKPYTGGAAGRAVVSGVAMLVAVPAVLMLAL